MPVFSEIRFAVRGKGISLQGIHPKFELCEAAVSFGAPVFKYARETFGEGCVRDDGGTQ